MPVAGLGTQVLQTAVSGPRRRARSPGCHSTARHRAAGARRRRSDVTGVVAHSGGGSRLPRRGRAPPGRGVRERRAGRSWLTPARARGSGARSRVSCPDGDCRGFLSPEVELDTFRRVPCCARRPLERDAGLTWRRRVELPTVQQFSHGHDLEPWMFPPGRLVEAHARCLGPHLRGRPFQRQEHAHLRLLTVHDAPEIPYVRCVQLAGLHRDHDLLRPPARAFIVEEHAPIDPLVSALLLVNRARPNQAERPPLKLIRVRLGERPRVGEGDRLADHLVRVCDLVAVRIA